MCSFLMKHPWYDAYTFVYHQIYLKRAEKSKDLHLSRDAWKKITNVYIQIAQCEPPFGSDSNKEVFASILELQSFSPEVVDENERTDLVWLRKFSKARSIYCFQKMSEFC